MIQKQMMMIISLFMATIAIILVTGEEKLAWLRHPYHTSVLTGNGWVMELLAGHPWNIHNQESVMRCS